MLRYKLNETEEKTLEKWVNSRKVKALLKKGSKLSLTFSETGIGLHVMAELDKGKVVIGMGDEPSSKDITDYESW